MLLNAVLNIDNGLYLLLLFEIEDKTRVHKKKPIDV